MTTPASASALIAAGPRVESSPGVPGPSADPLAALLASAERWIPLSGLVLVLFLVVHLAGIALAVLDAERFEVLADALHRQLWLPPLELALATALLLHPLLAVVRTVVNRRARGFGAAPLRSRRGSGLDRVAALANRWSPWSGALVLLFLVVHVGQLRVHRPPSGAEREVLLAALASPLSLALYGLVGVAVAAHLLQGLESAHRSLGWLTPANRPRIRNLGRALALLLGSGFSVVTVALVLQDFLAAANR